MYLWQKCWYSVHVYISIHSKDVIDQSNKVISVLMSIILTLIIRFMLHSFSLLSLFSSVQLVRFLRTAFRTIFHNLRLLAKFVTRPTAISTLLFGTCNNLVTCAMPATCKHHIIKRRTRCSHIRHDNDDCSLHYFAQDRRINAKQNQREHKTWAKSLVVPFSTAEWMTVLKVVSLAKQTEKRQDALMWCIWGPGLGTRL